jgi:hypothetical protein
MVEFSCDEVEKVLRRAYEMCLGHGGSSITVEHVRRAVAVYKHNYDPVMHELVALLSIQGTNFLPDLPWYDESGSLKEAHEDLPEFLTQVVGDDGRVNERLLQQRTNMLRQQAQSR